MLLSPFSLAAGGTVVLAALAAFAFTIGLAGMRQQRLIRSRMTQFAVPTDAAARESREHRLLAIAGRLGQSILRVAGQRVRVAAQIELDHAGLSARLRPEHLMAARLVGVLVGVAVAALIARSGGGTGVLLAVLLLAIFTLGPDLFLVGRAGSRRKAIERELPTLVDLMGLTMAAGMGFENALTVIAQAMPGPLAEEINRYQDAHINLGQPRNDALRAMNQRVGSADVTQFTESVIQAVELGSGLLSVINSQSRVLRARRRRQAEGSAKQAPVRMILPMAAFIFPVLMLIILGPAILRFMGASTSLAP